MSPNCLVDRRGRSVMEIGRGQRDVAQARCAEPADVGRAKGDLAEPRVGWRSRQYGVEYYASIADGNIVGSPGANTAYSGAPRTAMASFEFDL
jgi:hypothetical protein